MTKTRIRHPDEIIRNGRNELLKALGTGIRDEIPAQIGNPTTGAIYADTENTLIYVYRQGAESAGVTTIPVGSITNKKLIRYGQPILIKQVASGQYRFVGVDVQADQLYSAGLTETHTQDPVYLNQIRWGTIHPYSGLSITVVAAAYGDEYFVGDLITDAFDGTATDTSASAITVPTVNNRQIAVLIQLDASTGTLSYKQSTSPYPANISREVAYTSEARCPRKDAGKYRIGYVFLKAGMTTITYADIWEMPEIYGEQNSTTANDSLDRIIVSHSGEIVVSHTGDVVYGH